MQIEALIEKVNQFKGQITNQSYIMDPNFYYENRYLCVKRIDSSNIAGGHSVLNGKQWNIIFEKKKDFTHLDNWKLLKNHYSDKLKITKFRTSKKNLSINENCYGIRLYKMSNDPTREIIYDILNFIFNM